MCIQLQINVVDITDKNLKPVHRASHQTKQEHQQYPTYIRNQPEADSYQRPPKKQQTPDTTADTSTTAPPVVRRGQLAELKWCHSGSALLIHSTTEAPFETSGMKHPWAGPQREGEGVLMKSLLRHLDDLAAGQFSSQLFLFSSRDPGNMLFSVAHDHTKT